MLGKKIMKVFLNGVNYSFNLIGNVSLKSVIIMSYSEVICKLVKQSIFKTSSRQVNIDLISSESKKGQYSSRGNAFV